MIHVENQLIFLEQLLNILDFCAQLLIYISFIVKVFQQNYKIITDIWNWYAGWLGWPSVCISVFAAEKWLVAYARLSSLMNGLVYVGMDKGIH